jgi:excisionase family DNA binding protein
MLQHAQPLPHIGRLYTYDEVAAILGAKPHTIRTWIAQGKIGVIRLGRSVRIPESELYRITSQGWSAPTTR